MRIVLLGCTTILIACASNNGSAPPPATPHQATATSLASAGTPIVAGVSFSCAITPAQKIKCWGRNQHGQLGVASTTEINTQPAHVADLGDIVSIGAGRMHACALSKSGSVKCWGIDETAPDERSAVRTAPTEVLSPALGAVALTSGGRHDCVVTRAGSAKCWGWGSDGQLGYDGGTTAKPIDVVGLQGIASITAGDVHTCAMTSTGAVSCWGSARLGRLGNGAAATYAQSPTPVDVAGLGTKVTAISAGKDMSCAITAAGGVKCWGRVKPGRPMSDVDPSFLAATAQEVPGLSNVSAISVGAAHACVITRAGAALCWGWNETGQLGNGQKTDSTTPVAVTGLSSGVVAIGAGDMHTCALLDTGEARCWGHNEFGQLGDGTTNDSAVPVKVTNFP